MMCFECFMVGISALFGLIGIIHCIVFWLSRQEPAIRPRNPPVMCLWGIGNLVISFILYLNIFSSVGCYVTIFLTYSLINVSILPFMLRGLQYIIQISDNYRTTYWFLKSNVSILKCTMIFSFINYMIAAICLGYLPSYDQSCIISWDGLYLGTMTVLMTTITALVVRKMPWNFDYFSMDIELKLNFGSCIFFGLTGLIIEISFNYQYSVHWSVPSWVVLSGNLFNFCASIVWPLHTNVAVLRNTVSVNETKKAIFRVYLTPSTSSSQVLPVDFEIADLRRLNNSISSKFTNEYCFLRHSNFSEIFSDNEATKSVHDFSTRHFVPEMTLFLQQVHRFKNCGDELSNPERYRLYLQILSKFVMCNAPYELSISSQMKQKAMQFKSKYCDFAKLSKEEQRDILLEISEEVEDLFWRNYVVNFFHQ